MRFIPLTLTVAPCVLSSLLDQIGRHLFLISTKLCITLVERLLHHQVSPSQASQQAATAAAMEVLISRLTLLGLYRCLRCTIQAIMSRSTIEEKILTLVVCTHSLEESQGEYF